MKEPTQNESLLAAIADNLEGMSRIDLIFNVKVFREARDRVVKERDRWKEVAREAFHHNPGNCLKCQSLLKQISILETETKG